MKKSNVLVLLSAIMIMFSACTKTPEIVPKGKYDTDGIFIVNEGSFGNKNGTLSFLDNKTDAVSNGIFEAENVNAKFGGLVQSARIYNEKIYVITQSDDNIYVLDANTLKQVATISGIVSPYDIAFLGSKAYVTSWGANDYVTYPDASVKVIDLVSNKVTKTIGYGTVLYGITEYLGKIYVANAGANKINVIETANDTKSTEISNMNYPSELVVDRNGKLWALCSSDDFSSDPDYRGALVRINLSTNTIEKTISNIPVQGYGNEKIATYEDKVFYMDGNNIFSINITTPVVPTTAFITTTYPLYGLGISKVNGDIFVGEYVFSRGSKVGKYTKNGTFIKEYTAGVGTSTFVER